MSGMLRVRHVHHVVIALLLAPLLVLGLPGEAHAAHRATVSKIHRAMRIASHQIGDPYRYGAAGPGSFDCSGLMYYATHRAGFKHVPRTSSAQARFMRHIRRSAMRPGDFVFFTGGGGVYHVGMYLGRRAGHRVILHAPYTGSHVKRERIWTNSWFPGTLRGR